MNRQDTHLAYLLNISGSLDQGTWSFSGTFRMFVVAEITSGSLIRSVMTITILETTQATSTKTVESNYFIMPMADVSVEARSSLTQPILGLFTAQIQIDSSRDLNDCGINLQSCKSNSHVCPHRTHASPKIVYSYYTGLSPKNTVKSQSFVNQIDISLPTQSGDKWPVLIGVSFSGNLIWVGEISVNISAPKVSRPDLVVDLLQVQQCAYDGNTTAVLEVLVKHSVNSTGTAYNVTVNVYLPAYMAMRKNDFTVPLENTITVRQESTIIVTEIGRLTFSDPFTLEVTLDVDLSSQQILAAGSRVVTAEAIWGDRWGNLTDLLSDAVYLSVNVSKTCSKRLSWTSSRKCPCPHDASLSNCGCCVAGACPCGTARPRACAPCQEMWRCVPYKTGFEELLYLPKSAVTDQIRCDAFHMRRGSATGVSCHKILSSSPPMYLELSPRVAVVTGVDPSTGFLYGISNNGLAYMVSEDRGTSWTSIMDNVYANVTSNPAFIPANVTQVR
ncbi:unnamed protein product [Candidula unifasciata]|uniref:Uncharacterized protein n=1 Tax=Candidula unifasciata TaxID=100452 RepID=A0A8S3YJF9_9EUPU|nr:unnamed protein product [Candidula unifasciata]